MNWQYVTWAAGAATVAALMVACRPLLAAAAGRTSAAVGRGASAPGRQARLPAPSAIRVLGVLVVLVALVTAELTFDDLISPPAWARAGWAFLTAAAAIWLAAHGRELTRATGLEVVATPAGTASGSSPQQGSGRMADPLSEQDDLVQTLVVASYALQMGDEPRARQALDGALRRSRATLDELMRQRGGHGFVRAAPAAPSSVVSRNVSGLSS
ncbi:MFS transporter [Parafrankia sp. FMc2]|uniref:MFS transporter n=1 Tax=Parafrankia sp. FMc2 TaxID=3233196 RepID=UPI0034D622E7